MVSFNWGSNAQSLPQSAEYFKSEMFDYILGLDDSFRFKLNHALDNPKLNEETVEELFTEFREILNSILEEPLRPVLEKEVEGFKKFITNKRTSRSKTVSREGTTNSKVTEDIQMANTSNETFLVNKTVADLMDSNVTNRLKGMGGLQYGKKLENLPEFDFEEFVQKMSSTEIPVKTAAQLAFTEGKDKEGNPNGNFTYSHKRGDFTRPLNNHIEAKVPAFDVDELFNAQADWLNEKTGQSPNPKRKKTKTVTFNEVYDYNLVLPQRVLTLLEGDDVSSTAGYAEFKLSAKGKSFSQLSPKVLFSSDKLAITSGEWATLSANQRTPLMVKENIVEKDGKYYKFLEGAASSSNEESKKIVANFEEGASNTPFSFIQEHAATFLLMHKEYFNNPLTVNSLSLTANIKTIESDKASFGRTAAAVNAKNPSLKNPSPDRYEKVRHMVNSEGKKLSIKEYSELEAEKQADYEAYSSSLTKDEIEEMSAQAFKHNEDKGDNGEDIIISEDEYNMLSREDKSNYSSTTTVYSSPESSLSWKNMEDYSGKKHGSPSVTYETAVEQFSKSFILCEFTIHTHGKFDMHPFKSGGANLKLSEYINKSKKRINTLQDILGDE